VRCGAASVPLTPRRRQAAWWWRLSDRPDPVPDAIWDEAARHYDEKALAALVVQIALINTFNRLNRCWPWTSRRKRPMCLM
jgi:alkylhydroperoxidase family enzyme